MEQYPRRQSAFKLWASVALLVVAIIAVVVVLAWPQAAPSVVKTAAPLPHAPASQLQISPIERMERLLAHRNADFVVTAAPIKKNVKIGVDFLQFKVESVKDGYLYVLMVDTERQHTRLLFPNSIDNDNRIIANKPLVLPRGDWIMQASGPVGTDELIAVVSEYPRAFMSAWALTGQTPDALPSYAGTDAAANAATTDPDFMLGKPNCGIAGNTCSSAYGAARFAFEEIQ